MKNIFAPICWWLTKVPKDTENPTKEIDQALQEYKDINARQTRALAHVQQPDLLRSLVISMNAGRNR